MRSGRENVCIDGQSGYDTEWHVTVWMQRRLDDKRNGNWERKCADTICTVLELGWPFPMLIYKYIFQIKWAVYGMSFIKQHSETVMVWNYQTADCSLQKLIYCVIIIFGTLSFHTGPLSIYVDVDDLLAQARSHRLNSNYWDDGTQRRDELKIPLKYMHVYKLITFCVEWAVKDYSSNIWKQTW